VRLPGNKPLFLPAPKADQSNFTAAQKAEIKLILERYDKENR
jgi:hypothetical protein